jgi:hypothetical protein
MAGGLFRQLSALLRLGEAAWTMHKRAAMLIMLSVVIELAPCWLISCFFSGECALVPLFQFQLPLHLHLYRL